MIFWKEWRETRFAFLISLFFLTGLYYSIPIGRSSGEAYLRVDDAYWITMFLVFFVIGYAIIMGAGAFSAEIGGGTLSFLISQPVSRRKVLAAKFLVRGIETIFIFLAPMSSLIVAIGGIINYVAIIINIFYPPIMGHPYFKAHSNGLLWWIWVPPYIAPQYILCCLLAVIFIFSCTFLCSIILPKKGFAAVGGIVLASIYLTLQGIPVLGKVQASEQVKMEIVSLALLCATIFIASVFLFRTREY
jgi:hypothetical protein